VWIAWAVLRSRSIVYRVVSEVQRAFFDPPDLSRASGISKYR